MLYFHNISREIQKLHSLPMQRKACSFAIWQLDLCGHATRGASWREKWLGESNGWVEN